MRKRRIRRNQVEAEQEQTSRTSRGSTRTRRTNTIEAVAEEDEMSTIRRVRARRNNRNQAELEEEEELEVEEEEEEEEQASLTSPKLPHQIISKILSRVPVKSLLRFRCVSKGWRSLISDSSFVTEHLSHVCENNPGLILQRYPRPNNFIYSLQYESCSEVVKHDFSFLDGFNVVEVVGSCNGLLCLSLDNAEGVCLWNPATREYKVLPYAPILPPETSLSSYNHETVVGFGFDEVNNDYKVVRIVYFYRDSMDTHSGEKLVLQSDVKVYSLSMDEWGELGDAPFLVTDKVTNAIVYGAVHWMGNRAVHLTENHENRLSEIVLAFDLAHEMFLEIPQPNYSHGYGSNVNSHRKVAVLGGCLSVLDFYHHKRIEIWMMNDYGVKESWTRRFIIGLSHDLVPLQIRKNGQILLKKGVQKLVSYDPKNKRERIIKTQVLPNLISPLTYVESLVSLRVVDRVEGQHQAKGQKRKRGSMTKRHGPGLPVDPSTGITSLLQQHLPHLTEQPESSSRRTRKPSLSSILPDEPHQPKLINHQSFQKQQSEPSHPRDSIDNANGGMQHVLSSITSLLQQLPPHLTELPKSSSQRSWQPHPRRPQPVNHQPSQQQQSEPTPQHGSPDNDSAGMQQVLTGITSLLQQMQPHLTEKPQSSSQRPRQSQLSSVLPEQNHQAEPVNSEPSQQQNSDPSQEQNSDPSYQLGSSENDIADHASTQRKGRGQRKGQGQRKGRGPTRLKDVWDMPEGERLSVEENEYGQPVGPSATKLTRFMGTIARNGRMAPLIYSDWRMMPETLKEEMWQCTQGKFDIGPSLKVWFMKSMGKKWKEWKGRIKLNHYDPYNTDEEWQKNCPLGVDSEQWKTLIQFWRSEAWTASSTRNKAIRAGHKMARHTAGSKSFACVREEERMKNLDRTPPTRAEVFVITHTHKDGTPVDEASSVAISLLNEKASQLPESSKGKITRNDIFSQVMGEDTRSDLVRTLGLGPTASDLWGKKSSEALRRSAQTEEKVCKLEEELVGMKEQIAAIKELILSKRRSSPDEESDELHTPVGALVMRQGPNLSPAPEASAQSRMPAQSRMRATSLHNNSRLQVPNASTAPEASAQSNSPLQGALRKKAMMRKGRADCNSSNKAARVLLRSFMDPQVTVAKGLILNTDPSTKVGDVELGAGFCEVSVEVPMDMQHPLIRPHGHYRKVGDAIGASVAWMSHLVIPMEG